MKSFSLGSYFRKWAPTLLFFALGAVMLFGHDALLALTSFVNGAHDTPPIELSQATYAAAALGEPHARAVVKAAESAANLTGAEVAADAQAGGWVQAGAVTSKLIAAGGAYLFFVVLTWLVQGLTHPAPTAWAKKGYSTDFDGLLPGEKFTVYQRIRQHSVWLAIGALVFAAVVQ